MASAVAVPAATAARHRNDFRVEFPYRIGPFSIRTGTYRGAGRAFGKPAHVRTRWNAQCELQWDKPGLQLRFRTPSENPCSRDGLRRSSFSGASILSRRWRVDRGLRVGDSWSRLQSLYPAWSGQQPPRRKVQAVDLADAMIPMPGPTPYVRDVSLDGVIQDGRVLRFDVELD